jgi:PfaD family protein
LPHGFNLIHSPNEPDLEQAVVDLYLRRGVALVEASAYLDLTLPVVQYRTAGIHTTPDGRVATPNRIIAKVSRVEVASKFFSPPPERYLQELVQRGALTPEQASLASSVPMAQDVTAEADSGGHTDNRPAITLLPTLIALRDRLQARFRYDAPLRVGAAGGIATPASAVAAFAMGAAYVLTGSINQACVESGSSDLVREMLGQVEQADVIMAPAADMFEMGVKVQVLKRGTMFAMRAAKLYELYRAHGSLEEIPPSERAALEKNLFRAPLEEIWNQTRAFFQKRDPAQLKKAETDKKHRMALVFRWYLGLASRWANAGEPSRKVDYQVWCGPAMGAFNEWVKGSFLEPPANRKVVTVALNILYGAAVLTRLHFLRCQGVSLPTSWAQVAPLEPAELDEVLPETSPSGVRA